MDKDISYRAYDALKTIIMRKEQGALRVQDIAPSKSPPLVLSIVGPGWVELRKGARARRVFEYSDDIAVTDSQEQGLTHIRVGDMEATVRFTVGDTVVSTTAPVLAVPRPGLLHLQEVMGLLALMEKLKLPLYLRGSGIANRRIHRTFSSMDGGFFSEIADNEITGLADIELTPPGTLYTLKIKGSEYSHLYHIQLICTDNPTKSIILHALDARDVLAVASAGEDLSSTAWWLLNKLKTHVNKKGTETDE